VTHCTGFFFYVNNYTILKCIVNGCSAAMSAKD
jgi:hypothetical protein